jgi:hypothetical protein
VGGNGIENNLKAKNPMTTRPQFPAIPQKIRYKMKIL